MMDLQNYSKELNQQIDKLNNEDVVERFSPSLHTLQVKELQKKKYQKIIKTITLEFDEADLLDNIFYERELLNGDRTDL